MSSELGLRPVAKPLDLSVLGETTLSRFLNDTLSLPEPLGFIERGAVYLNRDRVCEEKPLRPRDCVRVHLTPRRFDIDWNWRERVLAEHGEFIVVNKPTGLPVHPTCDNAEENVLKQLERLWGTKLWVCHRLDIGTEGILLLGKSLEFRRWFAGELEARRVEKIYRARAERFVKPGRYEHFQPLKATAPFSVALERAQASDRFCALTVESCEKSDDGFELLISLHTGRHHQIRAQLAALGSPIVGDVKYGASTYFPVKGDGEALRLQSCALGFNGTGGETHRFELASPWR